MLLISEGPNPVDVLLCLGLLMPSGPTGPFRSEMGAEVEGFRSLVEVDVAMAVCTVQQQTIDSRKRRCTG